MAIDSVHVLLGSVAAGQLSTRHPAGGFGGSVTRGYTDCARVVRTAKRGGGGRKREAQKGVRTWESALSLDVVRMTLHQTDTAKRKKKKQPRVVGGSLGSSNQYLKSLSYFWRAVSSFRAALNSIQRTGRRKLLRRLGHVLGYQ
jgi:hypothetical protein